MFQKYNVLYFVCNFKEIYRNELKFLYFNSGYKFHNILIGFELQHLENL